MFLQESYRKEVLSLPRDAKVREAAREMEESGVGCIVVVEEEDYPVGMITDRDLTIRVLAAGLDPDQTAVEDVMTSPLVLATSDDALEDLIEKMRVNGIRRVPLTKEGHLAGIASLDEVLLTLSNGLHKLGKAARTQFSDARRSARLGQIRGSLGQQLDQVRRSFEGLGSGEERLLEELDKFSDRAEDLLSRLEEA